MSKEHPILFNAQMVNAILGGRKTQTRRVIKQQPVPDHRGKYDFENYLDDEGIESYWNTSKGFWHARCPHGKPGDKLWVRETWQSEHSHEDNCEIFYRADYLDDIHGPDGEKSPEGKYRTWRPSIYMPRWASRIILEVVNVRIERLQDISEEDAIAEGGVYTDNGLNKWRNKNPGWSHRGHTDKDKCLASAKSSFGNLWESINGQDSWDENPWVWVVEFKKL